MSLGRYTVSGARKRTAGSFGASQVRKLACSITGLGSSQGGGLTSKGTTNDVLAYDGLFADGVDATDSAGPDGGVEPAVALHAAARGARKRTPTPTNTAIRRRPRVVAATVAITLSRRIATTLRTG